MPEFLSAVRCFQDKTSNVEQAFAGTSWKSCKQSLKGLLPCAFMAPRSCMSRAEKFVEMALVLKYPEHNGRRDGGDPWSIRQTGVYQSFDPLAKTSLWILLNPRQDTAADTRIKGLLGAPGGLPHLHQEPPLIGLVVLSTYFANWRTYMAFHENEELRMVDLVMTSYCQTLDLIFFSVRNCYQR